MYAPKHPLKGLWTLKQRIEEIINETDEEFDEEELFLQIWKKYGYHPRELYRVRHNLGYRIDQNGKVRVMNRLHPLWEQTVNVSTSK